MIKIGYLVSYDYELLFTSIRCIYKETDKIFLAIDKHRITWSGNAISIPDTFFKTIEEIDKDGKISIYEDNFYMPELTPMENEIRERNMLLKRMGKGWLIQLDTDEYMCNFKEFVMCLNKKKYLLWFNWILPLTIAGNWITLFKKTDEGYLVVSNKSSFNFLTNIPKYTSARKNKWQYCFNVNIECYHQSWARDNEEIKSKINNWGHKNDFDTKKFYSFWQNIDAHNFERIKNFHPLESTMWKGLEFINEKNLDDIINTDLDASSIDFSDITAINILKQNSIIRFKAFKYLTKKALKKLRFFSKN